MRLTIFFLVVFLPSRAFADIYSDCQAAIEADDRTAALSYATTMMQFNQIWDPKKQTGGADCISYATGKTYVYSFSLGAFAKATAAEAILVAKRKEAAEAAALQDQKAEAERMARIKEARLAKAEAERQEALARAEAVRAAVLEAADAKRRALVWTRVLEGCLALYSKNPDETVTNRVCLDVFLETGLPAD